MTELVCKSDERISNVFKEHLNINDPEEIDKIVTRFYHSFYSKGKSLHVALQHSVLHVKPSKLLEAELFDLVTLY